ncbi:hypothetical protein ACFU99_27550, partial [Streptomyces sp. NPDC057654]|uniref:NADase-type glycan-binding domain-containing protein n=1 Tax=Streptomyces sp. NPDC057654 TaxID=3346196 RepID=UPI0036AD480D
IQDHFAKRVPVHPTSWADKHHSPKHEPDLAGDGWSNTWWGTGYAGDSAGQWIEARFQQPTDLLAMLVTPGSSARSAQSSDEARPMDFDLIVTDSAGKAHTSHHTLNDGGAQQINVRVRDAVTARFVIRSAYGTAKDKQVAIAELEFFRRATNSN